MNKMIKKKKESKERKKESKGSEERKKESQKESKFLVLPPSIVELSDGSVWCVPPDAASD